MESRHNKQGIKQQDLKQLTCNSQAISILRSSKLLVSPLLPLLKAEGWATVSCCLPEKRGLLKGEVRVWHIQLSRPLGSLSTQQTLCMCGGDFAAATASDNTWIHWGWLQLMSPWESNPKVSQAALWELRNRRGVWQKASRQVLAWEHNSQK